MIDKSLTFLLCFSSMLSVATSVTPKPNFLISFGDTATQTGFLTTGDFPSAGNPLGNPPYPGFTAVTGANYIDVLTVQLNKTLLFTFNFAASGSTIDRSLVVPPEPVFPTFTEQVSTFQQSIASKPANAQWTSASALFVIWFGVTDLYQSFGSGTAFDAQLIAAYFTNVQALFNAGARNFLFINISPLERTPFILADPPAVVALMKSAVADFNSQLVAAIITFKANNAGVKTFVFDANAAFNTVLNNPTAFGFKDATSTDNARSNTGHFWGNFQEPSVAAHAILASNISALLSGTIWF